MKTRQEFSIQKKNSKILGVWVISSPKALLLTLRRKERQHWSRAEKFNISEENEWEKEWVNYENKSWVYKWITIIIEIIFI